MDRAEYLANLQQEHDEIVEKRDNLTAFFETEEFVSMDSELKDFARRQWDHMDGYRYMLTQRIAIESALG